MTRCLCPVCGTPDPEAFLRRNAVPVQQNLLVASAALARNVTRGTLDLQVCGACGFVFNAAFDLSLLDYGTSYDNTQSCSAMFATYMDDLAGELVEDQGLRQSRIIEIGCGKGVFLQKLVEYPGSGNTGVGFDTSYEGPGSALNGRLRFERRFYDDSCAGIGVDAVVCRHVIEHVPEPLALMQSVRRALADAPDARLWFETPSVDWILENGVLWDFFYEHCSLFSPGSLSCLFREAGFAVDGVREIFGGQYQWLQAHVATESPADRHLHGPAARRTRDLALAYGARVEADRLAWADRLAAQARLGRLAIWGAGAKGATFANLVDPDASVIECVVDLNPAKQGRFIPGTGHPIVAPSALAERGIATVLVMNPNYRAEIAALAATLGLKLDLLEWSAR